MTEDELTKASVVLRRTLYEDMRQFWENHKGLKQDQVFFVNSVVIASLIAQITYLMFKKDIGNAPSFLYIDQMCDLAKQQLHSTSFLKESGIL